MGRRGGRRRVAGRVVGPWSAVGGGQLATAGWAGCSATGVRRVAAGSLRRCALDLLCRPFRPGAAARPEPSPGRRGSMTLWLPSPSTLRAAAPAPTPAAAPPRHSAAIQRRCPTERTPAQAQRSPAPRGQRGPRSPPRSAAPPWLRREAAARAASRPRAPAHRASPHHSRAPPARAQWPLSRRPRSCWSSSRYHPARRGPRCAADRHRLNRPLPIPPRARAGGVPEGQLRRGQVHADPAQGAPGAAAPPRQPGSAQQAADASPIATPRRS
jgi:hypothetical protein